MRRLLLAAGGGGSFDTPPEAIIRAIVAGGPPAADAYGYQLVDDQGATMDTICVSDDGAGAYVAVYHVAQTPPYFDVYVATSTDLVNWTRAAQLATQADIPQIAKRADGSFVVGWEDEGTPHKLRFRRYSNRANLLTATHTQDILLAQTLASNGGAEGTPNFFSAEEPMDIGFHYNDGTRDKLGRGTLTNFAGWDAATDPVDAVLAAAGVNARGEETEVVYLGTTLRYIEGQYTINDFASFRIWYWNGSTVALETITTHGGSTAQANITCSIVESPTGPGQVLFVGLFLHSGGAAAGEAGQAFYYRALP